MSVRGVKRTRKFIKSSWVARRFNKRNKRFFGISTRQGNRYASIDVNGVKRSSKYFDRRGHRHH